MVAVILSRIWFWLGIGRSFPVGFVCNDLATGVPPMQSREPNQSQIQFRRCPFEPFRGSWAVPMGLGEIARDLRRKAGGPIVRLRSARK